MYCFLNYSSRRPQSVLMSANIWLILFFLSSVLSGQDDPSVSNGADSPGECIELSLTSMLDGDWDAFTQVTLCLTPLEQKLQEVGFRFASAGDRFRKKFIDEYGEDAWERFNDPEHIPYEEGTGSRGNGGITVLKRSEIPKLAEEANENATEFESSTSIPNSSARMELIQRDGRWFMLNHTLFGDLNPEETVAIINFLGHVGSEIERFEQAIGLEGITPDDIDFEFGLASLKAMGMSLPNANSRFDVSSLPEPTPFENVGDVDSQIPLDLEAFKRYQESALELGNAFLKESPDAFIQLLAPEVQELVSPQSIQLLRNRVLSRWGDENNQITITDVSFDRDSGYQVVGLLGDEQDQASFTAFGAGEKWIGISIEADQFGIDTCNVTDNIEAYFEESETFNKFFINGNSREAYRILFDGAEPSGEDYNTFAQDLPENLVLLGLKRIGARVFGNGQSRQLRIMTLASVQEGEATWMARCSNDFDYTSDGWDFVEFDSGSIGGEFVLNDHQHAEAFLRALGDGDSQACMNLMHDELRAVVQPSVLEAFCADFQRSFGKYESIDTSQFSSKANFEEETPGIFSRGQVRFEKHTLDFESRHVLLGVTTFNLKPPIEKPEFTTQIEDISELDNFAKRFVELLLTKPIECLDLTSPELREELPEPKAWGEAIQEMLDLNGEPKSIIMTDAEFNEETGNLRFQCEIDCENRKLKGYIELSFSAVRSFVDQFNINVIESDEGNSDLDDDKK